ncbi:hypothetical protein HDR66_02630 [bacterium]|nr:hypothetical protein [bacterium]
MKPFGITNFVIKNGRIAVITAIIAMITFGAPAASVVQRQSGTAAAKPASRANNAGRMPTLVANTTTTESVSTTETPVTTVSETIIEDDADDADDDDIIIENKSSQFAESLGDATNRLNDTSSSDLADKIKQQRAALNAQSAAATVASAQAALSGGTSRCDVGLRDCMKKKCGNDYTDCAKDGDTIWGDKMDACRRNTKCTAHEYQLFSREIKADRDMNVKLASFNRIIDCGNEYNSCIVAQCGEKYTKCLGKSAGDAAISACTKIANKCVQEDSGMASRTMEVFSNFRQDAEKQVAADEKRLYELRDKMSDVCKRLGATFDERSLVCVYTVNFFAGNNTTPMASKKLYSGATFDCNQNWFGIDVTTFKENAYRETRSQTAASSSFMGSGMGMAAGAITSGAIDRAVDRQKAEKAAKKAEKEHKANFENNEKEKKDDKKTDKNSTTDKLNGAKDKVKGAANKVKDGATNAVNKVKGALKKKGDNDTGEDDDETFTDEEIEADNQQNDAPKLVGDGGDDDEAPDYDAQEMENARASQAAKTATLSGAPTKVNTQLAGTIALRGGGGN